MSMEFSRQEYWSGWPFPSPGDLPDPGIKLPSPARHTDSLPSEPPGKPKHAGVDSLPLLQEIFLTQEMNWALLHCKWILGVSLGSFVLSPPPFTYLASEILVARSCPTLYNPMDCSLPVSSVHGILQARILEWLKMCVWELSDRRSG